MNTRTRAATCSTVFVLALGMFAIGADGFVIAGILPRMASDLQVGIPQSGLLIAIFSLTYAVAAPVTATMFGGRSLKWILCISMTVFATANVAAASADSFGWLLFWRVTAAVSAAAYSPAAVASAIALMSPEKRGQATSLVLGGLTVALVTAVPLGSAIAAIYTWRSTFLFIGALAVIPVFALALLLPADGRSRVMSAKERLAPIRSKPVLYALVNCVIWMTGGFAVYTFISPITQTASGVGLTWVPSILFVYGAAAIAGNLLGGWISDRLGDARAALRFALVAHFFSIVLIGVALLAGPSVGLWLLFGAVAVFASSGWACTPPQTSRLLATSPEHAVQLISLNTMATYLGMALGASLGSLVLEFGGLPQLALFGAMAQLVALLMLSDKVSCA